MELYHFQEHYTFLSAPTTQKSAILVTMLKKYTITALLVTLLLVATESFMLTTRHPTIRLPFESKAASFLLRGFHHPEEDRLGSYRWSRGTSTIGFVEPVRGNVLILGLRVGPLPPGSMATDFTLAYQGHPPVTIAAPDATTRVYRLLVPQDNATANLAITLRSETTVVPPDTRTVGLRIHEATLTVLESAVVTPTVAFIIAQALLLLITALLLHRLATPPLPAIITMLLAALALLMLFQFELLLMYVYLVRLVVALAVLAALTYLALPLAERYAVWIAPPPLLRTLWGITILACLIRLGGSFYPLFAAYDLDLNVGRLLKTLSGNLFVTGPSIEFRNHIIVYPPGPYVLFLPGILLHIPTGLLVMGGIGIIDGFGSLTIAALARVLGASGRTAVFSALLYAAIPIHLTALWYGLTAQIFGQALMVPLTIALLVAFNPQHHPRSHPWLAAGVLLSMALLSHIGVAIIAAAWLGLAWLVLHVGGRVPRSAWWRFTLVLAISAVVGLFFVYSKVALLMIGELLSVGAKLASNDPVPVVPGLIYRAFRISFHHLGLMLLLPGSVLLLWRRTGRGSTELLGSWIGVVLIFLAIELMTALQVRYIYFLTPVACIAAGLLLDRLAARGRWFRYAAWGVLVLLLVEGSAYWFRGTFEDIMMSTSPLLR
jgi:toxin CptA